MGDAKQSDCVKVAVRLRPLSNKELGNNESSIIALEENSKADGNGSVNISDPEGKEKPAQFAFDLVFGTNTEQNLVYETVGKPALEKTLTGYNGTIFAYGQTGSGKSWCMMGGPGDLKGIIPRVNEQLFVRIEEEMVAINTRRFLVMCSFFEIYNEIIFDLLAPAQDRSALGAGLQVKEHPVLGIYVKDLQEIVVSDSDKLEKLMNSGTKNRAVSSTLMNSVSSRSHSIFIIKVHQKDDEDKSRNVFAKLNLVDLAGSERQKGTGASGQTLKEGANINKSLSALGNVINALVENANGKKVFVPFRNSKLTRVLQESLGGNSLCTMLATLSPAACNYEETLSTLRYANRAKAIKVSATKNEEASQISRLNAEIEELKKKLLAGGTGGGGAAVGPMADEERQEMQRKFQVQLTEMEHMVSSTWEEKKRLSSDQEAQLSKALDEHKRQRAAMQEESRKRFRLLQDQADLELSIRGLLDTIQALPSPAEGSEPSALRTGELPRQWLKIVASIGEVADMLKQQHTMALVFHGAFAEDLRLWIEGEEAADHGMARTGARRALTKLETLGREVAKLLDLETRGREKASVFATDVTKALREWTEKGRAAIMSEIREAEGDGGEEKPEGGEGEVSGEDQRDDARPESGLPGLYEQTLEDIARILQLVEQQAQARAAEIVSLAALEVNAAAELVLKGASFVPGDVGQMPEAALLRSLAVEAEPEGGDGAAAPEAGQEPLSPAKAPREERPLHEWSPDDCDDTVEGTEFALTRLVSLDAMNKKRTPQELLARPPPKFVHDVALLVEQATGFLQPLNEEWPDPREAKIDLLQGIADSVASALGLASVEFEPADVLKGKEVPRTLHLLQLLAVAAAREVQQPGGAANAKVHRDRRRPGQATASELRGILEAMGKCIQCAVEQQAARRDRNTDGGHASPTRELESSYRTSQERLEEESQARARLEQGMKDMKKEAKKTKSLLKERQQQLEAAQQKAAGADDRKHELRKQVEELRSGLLHRAQNMASSNPEVAKTRAELESVAKRCGSTSEAKATLASEVKRLQQLQIETDTKRENDELEVKRMKMRLAEGLDGPVLQQSEEIFLLQAEKQKWDVRVTALEEKMRAIVELDDAERKTENKLNEAKKQVGLGAEDVTMQLQVIIEERDGLREGMDLLWQEKANLESELESISIGYIGLSDRLTEKFEEYQELQEQLQQYESILAMLKENAEKMSPTTIRSPSPVMSNGYHTGEGAPTAPPPPPIPAESPPPAVPSPPAAPPLPGAAAPTAPSPCAADEEGSSNYSDDFEPREDEEDDEDEN